MSISPLARIVSGNVHPLFVILRSVSEPIPWIIWLVAGLSPRRFVFGSRLLGAVFIVDKVALRSVFLPILRVSPVIINQLMPQPHIASIYDQCYIILTTDSLAK